MLRIFFVMILFLSLWMLCISTCYADTNWSGFDSCDPRPSNATSDDLKTNVNSILSILEEKGPQGNGFYKTTVGKGPEKVYGLVQCTGDVSAQDCGQCIKDAAHVALYECNNTQYFAKWYRWCYVEYFYEMKDDWEWDGDGVTMSTSHGNGTDEPDVVLAGMGMIHKLALDAPDQPRLFKTATVDVGRSGRRYGLAQCIGDLGKGDCRKCLIAQARVFEADIGNKSSLVVAGNGCAFWYDDYQFYFNYTAATDGYSHSPDTRTGTVTVATIAFLLFFFMLTSFDLTM